MINVNVFCVSGLIRGFKDVGQARIGPCEVDHRQSHRNQDAQNCQSESHEARAGPLPAQGEAVTFKHRCHVLHKGLVQMTKQTFLSLTDEEMFNKTSLCFSL